MQRIAKAAIAAMCLSVMSACGSAKADTVLRYVSPSDPKSTLTIEASGDGKMRIEDDRGQVVIVRDGEKYLVFTPPGGNAKAVTRVADYMAVGGEVRARMVAAGAMTEGEDNTPYAPRPQGARTVGKWKGEAVEIGPVDAPGTIMTIVTSTDPTLAEAHKIAVPALEAFEEPSRAVLVFPKQYVTLTSQTLAKGMPVSFNGLDLKEIGTGPVAATRFDLPQKPLTRDELRALMPK